MQFPQTEGLHNVVVRTKFETDHTVDLIKVATSRDNDRNI